MFKDIYALREAISKGEIVEYLHFWGHTQKTPDQIDKSCLSQWFVAPFIIDNVTYHTAEHFMMAGKARVFNDPEVLAEILQSTSPSEAKKLGRKVHGFDDKVWKRHRMEYIIAGNYAKFSQHEKLKAFLLSTGNHVLVEVSPYDKIWGIGMNASNENAANPLQWQGLNLLGFALMRVREQLHN